MKALAIAAALIIAAPSAFAQTGSTPAPNAQQRVDQRQVNQERRIEQGEKSGALTQREANRLDKGQARVESIEQKAAADGSITRKEAAHVQHAQNVESRRIARQKHDRQHDFNHDGKKDLPRR
jgi:hypothetical protein